ncbi:hypothetical protein ACWCPX_29495 [Streptomyces olivaceoviridis]
MASTTQQAGSALGLAVLVAVANSGVQATTGPTLVPGLRTTGFAAALTLLGVAIAPSLRSASSPRAARHRTTEARNPSARLSRRQRPGRGEDGQLLTRSRPHHPE